MSQCERIITALGIHDKLAAVKHTGIQPDKGTLGNTERLNGRRIHLKTGRSHKYINVMILLPERTFGNDCVFTRLAESDQIKILL